MTIDHTGVNPNIWLALFRSTSALLIHLLLPKALLTHLCGVGGRLLNQLCFEHGNKKKVFGPSLSRYFEKSRHRIEPQKKVWNKQVLSAPAAGIHA